VTSDTLTCRELVEFLQAYLDGELEAGERARFAAHLEICPDCVDYLESYRKTIGLAREALLAGGPEGPVSEQVPERLVRAVLAARRA
jgi:anti-sigma factor RsiW